MIKVDKLEFLASLPPLASAIQISGLGDGAILKLEIPASELYSIVQLQLLAGKVFKVTIEEIEDMRYGKSKTKTNSTKSNRGKSGKAAITEE
jgi:hypothetical protein